MGSFPLLADLARGGERIQGAAHDLRGPRLALLVIRARLQQLGVGEDNAELVVQAMEQCGQVSGAGRHAAPLLVEIATADASCGGYRSRHFHSIVQSIGRKDPSIRRQRSGIRGGQVSGISLTWSRRLVKIPTGREK